MTKERMVRDEPSPTGDTEVFRAHLLEDRVLRENALANYEAYGFYGLSAFYPIVDWTKERVLSGKLGDFPLVTVLLASDLEANGLTVLPTGARPHGDIVEAIVTGVAGQFAGEIDALVASIKGTPHRVEQNPQYRGEEAQ